VYHATTIPAGNCGNERTTRIQRFGWLPDGKPDFGVPLALDRDIEVPSGE
jgi:GH43 family beta-xylosidase